MFKRFVLFSIIFFPGFILCFSNSSFAQEKSEILSSSANLNKEISQKDRLEKVRLKIIGAVENGKIPSMAVAATKNGEIIWEEGFGWADKKNGRKATEHTMYSLASISKPVTSTGLMILVEKGKVDIKEPANKYIYPARLTAYEGNSSDATVKHILNHTSGLPLHYTFFYEDEPYNPPSMEESIKRYGILVHPPGEVYQYANFGFGIIDFIISKVSGKSFAEYMEKEVFSPLGMTHTSVGIKPGLEKYAAARYDSGEDPIPFYTFDHAGASAVYSSAHDLVRFGMFHLKNRLTGQKQILKDETIDYMHMEKDPYAVNKNYALGWGFNKNDYGYFSAGHGGGMPGVTTNLKIFPEENIAIVVLVNCGTGFMREILNDITGAILPEYEKKLKNSNSRQGNNQGTFKPSKKLSGEWSGKIKTYEGEFPVTGVIKAEGNTTIRFNDQDETQVRNIRYRRGWLTGTFKGTIPTEDTKRYDHNIFIKMRLKNGKLSGYISARSTTRRVYWALSSYISLEK